MSTVEKLKQLQIKQSQQTIPTENMAKQKDKLVSQGKRRTSLNSFDVKQELKEIQQYLGQGKITPFETEERVGYKFEFDVKRGETIQKGLIEIKGHTGGTVSVHSGYGMCVDLGRDEFEESLANAIQNPNIIIPISREDISTGGGRTWEWDPHGGNR